MSFYIDRIFQVVHKPEILSGALRNGCVRGGLHIAYLHGMIVPLCHLQFRKQYCIVQCCGYLADTASQTFHNHTVQIGSSQMIPVLFRKRADSAIGRKFLSRINGGTVDQLTAIGHIGAPACTG